MSHTERRRWVGGATYGESPHIDPDGMDRKCRCWHCSAWKRPARRRERRRARAAMLREPETAITRGRTRRMDW